jgi:anti-repressor protein
MNELIKIENRDGVETVNARELHDFLDSKQDYSTWIKVRITKYGFEEGVDYIRFHKKMEANNATMVEYHITVDMAKELSMVENNDKGREARQYFIAMEKRAKSQQLTGPALIASALIEANKVLEERERQLSIMAPKAELADIAIRDQETQMSITLAGKHICLSQSEIFFMLREKGLLTMDRLPTQKAINKRILTTKSNIVDGKNYPQAVMTMENIYNFREYFKEHELMRQED